MQAVAERRPGGKTPPAENKFRQRAREIRLTDAFVLNPVFRLRNESNYVLVEGWLSVGTYHVPHTAGIVLALCNGNRTVEDIARISLPFVSSDQKDPVAEAQRCVKEIIAWFSLSKTEQETDTPDTTNQYPTAALIRPTQLDTFGRMPRVAYDAEKFLPKFAPAGCDCPRTNKRRAPTRLNWHLTSACATDCRYCYLERRNVAPLQKGRVIELFHEAREIGVLEIVPGGGDVLLCPELIEYLHLLQDLGFMPVQLATKAVLNKTMAKQLTACDNVYELQFSIDSTVPDVAGFMVRRLGFYETTVSSIQNALDAGLRVVAKAVVTPYNILTIPRLYREMRAMGVEIVRIAAYTRSGYHHSDDLFNTPESFSWLTEQVEKLKEEFPGEEINVQNGPPQLSPRSVKERQSIWKNRSRCTAGRSSMMVCTDGKVIPCEQVYERDQAICGDLSTQSILEVWNGKPLAELTTAMPKERFQGTECHECAECEECHSTMGMCIRDTFMYYGTPYMPSIICPKAEVKFVRAL